MEIRKTSRPRALISLVPMIDVMLILLVFFMVTSTYLNLDMIPASQRDRAAAAPAPDTAGEAADPVRPVLIRLGADGVPHVLGRALDGPGLGALLAERLAEAPGTPVLVLPSGAAPTQALITVMDVATRAGASQLRVVRLEARP
jgi:biopolymer transport protein ExbD